MRALMVGRRWWRGAWVEEEREACEGGGGMMGGM